jgi:colanic acid biosynthesis glycosyl transferase WcaI
MKILVFSDHFYPEPSAPAAHVYERCKLWAKAGHEVTVLCSAPNFPEGRVYPGYRNAWRSVEVLEGVRVVRVKTFISSNQGTVRRTLDYISYMLSAWFFSLLEPKPEVIISSSPHLFVALAGVVAGMCKRVPHVFEIRDLWPASIAATLAIRTRRVITWLERLELWMYRRSTRILALTPSFKRDLCDRGIPENKIDVVISGANLALFSPAQTKDERLTKKYRLAGKFVIGYLGTIGLAHGLENVVSAAEMLRETDACFFFVGVGAARGGLVREVERLGLDNVVFAPRQLKEDMPRFWSVCDASLVHLRDEPVFRTVIPSKIFESMAVGLPIIYSAPEGDGSHIVRTHDAGIVVPPMQPRALADAVALLMTDAELSERFARNSAAAASSYSREKQAMESLSVLEKAAIGSGEHG